MIPKILLFVVINVTLTLATPPLQNNNQLPTKEMIQLQNQSSKIQQQIQQLLQTLQEKMLETTQYLILHRKTNFGYQQTGHNKISYETALSLEAKGLTDILEDISTGLSDLGNDTITLVSDISTDLVTLIGDSATNTTQFLTDLLTTIVDLVSTLLGGLGDVVDAISRRHAPFKKVYPQFVIQRPPYKGVWRPILAKH